jgi:hypothetical protein
MDEFLSLVNVGTKIILENNFNELHFLE